MNFELELKMDDAEQETVYLNDFIEAHDIQGLQTEVAETEVLEGTMAGGDRKEQRRVVGSKVFPYGHGRLSRKRHLWLTTKTSNQLALKRIYGKA